jgi:hypothetical protein
MIQLIIVLSLLKEFSLMVRKHKKCLAFFFRILRLTHCSRKGEKPINADDFAVLPHFFNNMKSMFLHYCCTVVLNHTEISATDCDSAAESCALRTFLEDQKPCPILGADNLNSQSCSTKGIACDTLGRVVCL